MRLMLTIAGGIVLGILALAALVVGGIVVIAKVKEHKDHKQYLESIKQRELYEQTKDGLQKKWEYATIQQVEAYFKWMKARKDAPVNLTELHFVTERFGKLKQDQKNYAELQEIIKEYL